MSILLPLASSFSNEEYTAHFQHWLHSSTLVVHVAILASAYYLASDVERSVDVMTSRSELIEMINAYLNEHEGEGVSDDAIVAVMGLSFLEVSF